MPRSAVRTKTARAALPAEVPMADAVFNTAHGALLVLGLARGDWDLVARGLDDRLHQPRREHLYPRSMELVRARALVRRPGRDDLGRRPDRPRVVPLRSHRRRRRGPAPRGRGLGGGHARAVRAPGRGRARALKRVGGPTSANCRRLGPETEPDPRQFAPAAGGAHPPRRCCSGPRTRRGARATTRAVELRAHALLRRRQPQAPEDLVGQAHVVLRRGRGGTRGSRSRARTDSA